MEGIAGRVAIVTGAGRGIGRGVALALAQEGASVIVNDLDPEPLEDTIAHIGAMGSKAAGLAGSVTEADIGERLAALAVERFGDLHIAVAAAGFTWDGMTHRMSDEQWQSIIDVHLTGTFRVVRDAFKVMRDNAKAVVDAAGVPLPRHIVTVSSQSGFGNVGQVNYSAAKAGIVGLTRTVALEGAPFNILANSVAFGMIDTRLTKARESQEERLGEAILGIPEAVREKHMAELPMKRTGTVAEAVGPILFLTSDLANFVSGALLEVNGAAHIS